jgi:hypothetical protein
MDIRFHGECNCRSGACGDAVATAGATGDVQVPDAAAVYQEFANRQLQIITDSNRRLLKDSEDLLKTNTRLFSIKSGGFSS